MKYPIQPTPRRGPRPVESFGPELLSTFLKGATERFEVQMPYNIAVRFRSRLHSLRFAMEQTKHPKYPLVAKVQIKISWPEGTEVTKAGRYVAPRDKSTMCTVAFAPNDQEFGSFLRNVGVDLNLGLEKRLEESLPEPSRPIETKTLEDLFADLDGKGKPT